MLKTKKHQQYFLLTTTKCHYIGLPYFMKRINVVTCDDGDKAVDEYIRIDPDGRLALDIPSMMAIWLLEMREHGKDCRILFSAPKRQAQLAHDATHSAALSVGLRNQLTSSMIQYGFGTWSNS